MLIRTTTMLYRQRLAGRDVRDAGSRLDATRRPFGHHDCSGNTARHDRLETILDGRHG